MLQWRMHRNAGRSTAVLNNHPIDTNPPQVHFRRNVAPEDRGRVRAIVESTGFFNEEEADVAVELVDERLAKGAAGGYEFVFAEVDAETVGYACFGRVPLTQSSFDLYWVAVRPGQQRGGLGRALVEEVERQVASLGGGQLYADTSGREQYAPTRAFYTAMGYAQAARLPDFFAPGDDKVVFAKRIASPGPPPSS
ncbi:MAG: N-acetyltransferase family protein [Thermoguttaceae bacterium]